MTAEKPSEMNIPPHIAESVVRDFDFYDVSPLSSDIHLAWKRVQDDFPEVFWTPRNGGHWVVTRADDIIAMQMDDNLVSYARTSIPPNPTPSLPLEADPPLHGPLRATISPLFTPQVLREVERQARAYSIDLIESFRPTGHCEFVSAFAQKLPIAIFLMLVDLPLADADRLLPLASARVKSPDQAIRANAKQEMLNYLGSIIRTRRQIPGNDFISKILETPIDGRPLTDYEAENILTTVMFGGLHTVATMMAFVMRHLARQANDREALRLDPSSIPNAVNEILRRYGIVATSRIVRNDVNFGRAKLRAGDTVLVPSMLAGLDDRRFSDPMRTDIRRSEAGQHAAFGNGAHRCPGANLARLEIKILIEEWLRRIPSFSVNEESVKMSSGIVAAIEQMIVRW